MSQAAKITTGPDLISGVICIGNIFASIFAMPDSKLPEKQSYMERLIIENSLFSHLTENVLEKDGAQVAILSLAVEIVYLILQKTNQNVTEEKDKIYERFEKSQCLDAIEKL